MSASPPVPAWRCRLIEARAPEGAPTHVCAPPGHSATATPTNRKVNKLLDAKTAGAAEAHLFLWLNFGEEHKRGRADAMYLWRHTGLDGLEPINLHGIDAVWVAVDAGPGHAPDCRHTWPILCFDADGWHDWQLRRSR